MRLSRVEDPRGGGPRWTRSAEPAPLAGPPGGLEAPMKTIEAHLDASGLSFALVVGRFPGRFASSYPDEPIERLAEVHKALKVVAPELKPFELRRLAPGDYVVRGGSRRVGFALPMRESLWRGTRAKIADMEHDAHGSAEEVGVEASSDRWG